MTADSLGVEVRRVLTARPARVFAAFAEPKLIERWLSPSPVIPVKVLDFDFREGGAYRFAYHVPHAPTVFVGGVYRVIEAPRKIVFSWVIEPPDEHAGIDSEVTVTITPHPTGAELVIQHEKLRRPDAMARHAEGWRGALDQLVNTLEE